jgi:catalase-peroxidase
LEKIAQTHNASVADVIVLGGNVGVEEAIKKSGLNVKVPFTSGRSDATQEETDVDSFKYLEPKVDGFRNVYSNGVSDRSPEHHLVDRSHLLGLTAPEMSVLVAGLRVLLSDKLGQLTHTPGQLDNSWFVNLLSMD